MQSPALPRYLVPLRSILISSPHLHLGLPSGLLPSGFPTKTLYAPSPQPYAPHAQPISFFSILPPAQYWMRSTNHLAPRYAISSFPPLTRSTQIHPNIIHLSTPRSPQWSLSLRFPHQDPIHPPLLTHTHHMPSPSNSSRFYHPHNIG